MTAPLTIAVFGATSGIAEAAARLWAARGARLFLAGRNGDRLAAVAQDLRVRGAAEVAVWSGDLSDLSVHQSLTDAMLATLGTPDVLLLAWGTLTDQARAEVDPTYAAREISTNFTAPAALLLTIEAVMIARGRGVVACITSVAGDRGRASNFAYGSAKGGLQRFLEGYAHRLHEHGVKVLDIRPGFVATPMTAHLQQSGPLWATPSRVAGDIVRAVDGRRAVLYTPWFWRWIMLVVRALPRAVLYRTKL